MFDPDNFYEILRCKYSWPRTPNLLLYFQPHGSKNLSNLKPFGKDQINDIAFGKIVLHDQEPFSFIDAAHTYRQYEKSVKIDRRSQKILDNHSPETLITMGLKSGMQPIFCHSEVNSADIKSVVDGCLAIGCYYWYHAMISRDWFRHWEYHPDMLPKDRSSAPSRFMLYARGLDGTREYRKKFLDLIRPYQDQIYQGQTQIMSIPSDHSAKLDVQDANIAAIHIVLETLFETSKIHLTEKVFKPMVMSQPFFLLAGPGSLKYLKDYGFRTFGDFWDESYDLIPDHKERMHRIKEQIEKIFLLSQNEFQDLYKKMIPVIAHNRRHFFSRKFQDYCVQEMENNFQSALDLQKENLMIYPGGSWARLMAKLTEEKKFLGPSNDYRYGGGDVKQFLNSKYLPVPKEKIIEHYPILETYSNRNLIILPSPNQGQVLGYDKT